jgi:serpin B
MNRLRDAPQATACAEFDGIRADHLPVWIERVLHRAVAEVNEEGTVAAAATDFSGYFGIEEVVPPSHFEMIVDRPFMFVIGDQSTGTILFMGWIGNPQLNVLHKGTLLS